MGDSASRVLLATDGSAESEFAVRAAVELCERTGSDLHVVHVGPVVRYLGDVGPVILDHQAEQDAQERINRESRQLLDAEVKKVEEAGVPAAEAHLRTGHPADLIVRLAEDLDTRMIVIGSRGRGGIRRALMGGVSDSVVRHARCPVLVVRQRLEEPGSAPESNVATGRSNEPLDA